MNIISLSIDNIRKITALYMEPTGSAVIVGGKNGAGKSTTLDSIMFALGGQKAVTGNPIQDGEDEGKVTLDLGKYKIIRTFKRKEGGGCTSSLKVENEDGATFTGAQKFLDEICGPISFDPLAYIDLAPKKQLEILQELVGLNFEESDALRLATFEKRTQVNREVKNLTARISKMVTHDAPDKEVSVTALMEELKIAESNNTDKEAAANALEACKQSEVECAERISELTEELEQEKHRIKMLSGKYLKAETAYNSMEEIPTDSIKIKINESGEVNRKVRENLERAEAVKEVRHQTKVADTLTTEIHQIDADKDAKIKAARLPVEGLSFGECGVIYKGMPLEDICSGDQTRISTAMGLAMNPTLKVMLIRGGSLLDSDNLKMIDEMAKEADAQIWIERVGAGEEVEFLLEEGELQDGK